MPNRHVRIHTTSTYHVAPWFVQIEHVADTFPFLVEMRHGNIRTDHGIPNPHMPQLNATSDIGSAAC